MEGCRERFPEVPVERACALLGLNRGSLYRHAAGAEPEPIASHRPQGNSLSLRAAVERVVLEFPGYGYRRVTKHLQREGWNVNRKRVLRVMREESLLCQLKRRWTKTTDSQHGWRVYPNRLVDCGWRRLTGLDEAWVADLTYIRLGGEFVYLATVMDAYSRRVLGWCLSRTLEAELALTALERALAQRQPPPGWIHHSDRGVQYACAAYVARLEAAGACVSMAAKGSPLENAQAERLFRTLKEEEVYLQEYETFEEAEASIGRFIEEVYNRKRLHSSLGYRPPCEFEELTLTGAL
jgi:transposase InsO family protein